MNSAQRYAKLPRRDVAERQDCAMSPRVLACENSAEGMPTCRPQKSCHQHELAPGAAAILFACVISLTQCAVVIL
jgi:hypothetical protein